MQHKDCVELQGLNFRDDILRLLATAKPARTRIRVSGPLADFSSRVMMAVSGWPPEDCILATSFGQHQKVAGDHRTSQKRVFAAASTACDADDKGVRVGGLL